jgi:hypothetical protein
MQINKDMKATIEISEGSYGFGHNWSLVINESKSFYLGQDGKFCRRVLGMEPAYIVQQIGSNDLREPKVRARLAKFIIKSLGLTVKQLNSLQPWELSAE